MPLRTENTNTHPSPAGDGIRQCRGLSAATGGPALPFLAGRACGFTNPFFPGLVSLSVPGSLPGLLGGSGNVAAPRACPLPPKSRSNVGQMGERAGLAAGTQRQGALAVLNVRPMGGGALGGTERPQFPIFRGRTFFSVIPV